MAFVDRKGETAALEEELGKAKEHAVMAVVYGRRRIGKTELIKRFISDKEHIYFLATLQSKEEVIVKFSHKAAEFFKDNATMEHPHTTWDGFFEYLIRELKRYGKPVVLAFDEYTYLIQQDAAILSVFQYYWDEHLKNMPLMLILCGSYVGMMEKEVLSHNSPLYGRRSIQLFLSDIDFSFLKEFFPAYSKEEMVESYAILGGVPSYLLRFDSSKKVKENIIGNFLDKNKALYADGLILLREELKEPRNYLSILKAISFGKNTQKEIADQAHLEPALVGKYLDVLRGMKIVERVVPVTERNPEKSKRGIYRINDNYYNFWLKFVYPYSDYVEEGRVKELMENIIEPQFNTFVGHAFEKLARNALLHKNAKKQLPAYFENIGPWWEGETEIDIVGINKATKDILFAEVKWSEMDGLDVTRLVAELKEKVGKVDWKKNDRKEHYMIIAKKFKQRKGMQGVSLVELDELH